MASHPRVTAEAQTVRYDVFRVGIVEPAGHTAVTAIRYRSVSIIYGARATPQFPGWWS